MGNPLDDYVAGASDDIELFDEEEGVITLKHILDKLDRLEKKINDK